MNELEYTGQRVEMVRKQLVARGIHNPDVLNAFLNVRRHLFVPEENRTRSYRDRALSIGFDQSISQPYIVAFMTEMLRPDKTMRALEIGTGSGYQTAILSCLCKEVFSIELIETLGMRAKHQLKEEGYQNITLKIDDGYKGWNEYAPFDVILVTCAPNDIPPLLVEQLAENGKIVVPAGESHKQKLYVIEKHRGITKQLESIPVRFVPMMHKKRGKDIL